MGLRDQEARKKRELPGGDMAGWFIAEGDLVIERALARGFELTSVLIPESRTKPLPESISTETDVFVASARVLTEITGRPGLRDTLSSFVRPPLADVGDIVERASTVVVLENVNNPNNLGVIVRNAVGLGVDAVLLDPRSGDPLYRRAIRASMGQVFAVPHARLGPLPEGLDVLHESGFQTVALTPAAPSDIRDIERHPKVAVLLGAEGSGLEPATIDAATTRARITMSNDVDSLNVASAAAIALHHFAASPERTA